MNSTAAIQRSIMPMIAGAVIVVACNATLPQKIFTAERVSASDRTDYGMRAGRSPWATADSYAEEIPAADPWLSTTMAAIAESRAAGMQTAAMLSRTEELAGFLSSMESSKRPVLMIDSEGISNFATASASFYLHLTLDTPSEISWIADIAGTETEQEGVPFDGASLPNELLAVFA